MSGQFDVISGIPSSLCWLIRAYLIDLSIFKNMSGSRPAGHTSMHYAGKALENEINVNLCWKRGDRMIYINCCKSCFICTLAVLLRQTHECLCANHCCETKISWSIVSAVKKKRSQLIVTCSKSTIETLKKMWNMFKVYNKNSRTTSVW